MDRYEYVYIFVSDRCMIACYTTIHALVYAITNDYNVYIHVFVYN